MGIAIDCAAILARFPQMPDDALVPDKAAAALLGISYHTLRKLNPMPPVMVGARKFRRAGAIRAHNRGQHIAQQAKHQPDRKRATGTLSEAMLAMLID
ncbi:MAG: hypothetical protein J2P48_21390 [Alphaproteobacteria bacterium]|nr:hypothetical protein [Alphaproteobacteria bacterium]MBO0758851.1 hypothetical protein [Bradyrhizobiaceae bacterium]